MEDKTRSSPSSGGSLSPTFSLSVFALGFTVVCSQSFLQLWQQPMKEATKWISRLTEFTTLESNPNRLQPHIQSARQLAARLVSSAPLLPPAAISLPQMVSCLPAGRVACVQLSRDRLANCGTLASRALYSDCSQSIHRTSERVRVRRASVPRRLPPSRARLVSSPLVACPRLSLRPQINCH